MAQGFTAFKARTEWIQQWLIRLCSLTLLVAAGCAEPRPNVVVILTDDQGWVDLGSYGSADLDTPNLDRLAEGGVRLTSFYAAAGSCSPSRAALLTGMYPQRVGIPGVLMPQSRRGLHVQERTLAEMLRDLGYATAMVGKWHLGHLAEHLPTHHGFDSYFGIPYSNDMTPDSTLNPNPYARRHPPLPLVRDTITIETQPDQSQLTRRYTEHAVEFIEAHAGQPFFLFLAHAMPHTPLHAGAAFAGRSRRGLYGDVIMEIDWSTGAILETLERLGLERKTLIVFTSDNGPWLVKGAHSGSAGPLREGKGTTFEGGQRVPMILSMPGTLVPGVTDEVSSNMDIMPTVAGLTGAPVGPYRFDGHDLMPVLAGSPMRQHPFFYYQGRQLQAVRQGRWKLHIPHRFRSIHGARLSSPTHPGAYTQDSIGLALFDLGTDIGETTNLADQYPEVVNRLMVLMDSARTDLGDALTQTSGRGTRKAAVTE